MLRVYNENPRPFEVCIQSTNIYIYICIYFVKSLFHMETVVATSQVWKSEIEKIVNDSLCIGHRYTEKSKPRIATNSFTFL